MFYYKLDYIQAQLCMKFVALVQIIKKVMSDAAKCLSYLTTPCNSHCKGIYLDRLSTPDFYKIASGRKRAFSATYFFAFSSIF